MGVLMKLKDKVALVTGTSPNIGGGIAEALAAEGASLVCVDANSENATDCANYLSRRGSPAFGIECDVTDEEQVTTAVRSACERFGRVDILVNNAVQFNKKGVLTMPLAEWRRQIDIILTGTFLFTKHCAQSMIDLKVRGNMLNIVSTAGHQGEPNNVGYATAKAGMLNFTRSTAMELARYSIRVNSLTPTATDPSEMVERALRWGRPAPDISAAQPRFEMYRSRIPMQKLPKPSDYGRAAAFIVSSDAEMITGTDLRIDAGAIARYWPWDPAAK
jgi:NAD(P)-dependent dehydrogenase (short-subunit alcohol dehydrogenase family)